MDTQRVFDSNEPSSVSSEQQGWFWGAGRGSGEQQPWHRPSWGSVPAVPGSRKAKGYSKVEFPGAQAVPPWSEEPFGGTGKGWADRIKTCW